MYSVLNTLSDYTYIYILKNITSYTFLYIFKIVGSLQCTLNYLKFLEFHFWVYLHYATWASMFTLLLKKSYFALC